MVRSKHLELESIKPGYAAAIGGEPHVSPAVLVDIPHLRLGQAVSQREVAQ